MSNSPPTAQIRPVARPQELETNGQYSTRLPVPNGFIHAHQGIRAVKRSTDRYTSTLAVTGRVRSGAAAQPGVQISSGIKPDSKRKLRKLKNIRFSKERFGYLVSLRMNSVPPC